MTFPPNTMELQINGERLHLNTRRRGQGEIVLFLHGLLHSSRIWNDVIETLPEGIELIAVDLPGFGDSQRLNSEAISWSHYVEIINAIITDLSKKTQIRTIVADSLSAMFIVDACLRHQLHGNVILLSGCPFGGLPAYLRHVPRSLVYWSLVLVQKLPYRLSSRIIKLFSSATVHQISSVNIDLVRGVLAADPETNAFFFNALKSPLDDKFVNGLKRNQCTILRGRFDGIAVKRDAANWVQNVGATYIELDQSGHTPMIEQSREFARVIEDLVDRSLNPGSGSQM